VTACEGGEEEGVVRGRVKGRPQGLWGRFYSARKARGATARATMAINGHGGGRLLQNNQGGRLIEVKRKRVKEGE
jgi:hypothetical protein